MFTQPPPAPSASTVGTCPTVFQISRTPGTESLPSTFASNDRWVIMKGCVQWNPRFGLKRSTPLAGLELKNSIWVVGQTVTGIQVQMCHVCE